jgi:hypothetical protein
MATVRPLEGAFKGPTNNIMYSADHAAVGAGLSPRENAAGETIDEFGCFSTKYFFNMVWVRDIFVALTHVVGAVLVLAGAVNFAREANFLKYDDVRAEGNYDNGHMAWVLWCAGYSMITASNGVAFALTIMVIWRGKQSRVYIWWAEREPKDAGRLALLFVTNLLVAIYSGASAAVHAVDLSVLEGLDCDSVDRHQCAKHRVVAYQIVYGVRRFATPDMGMPGDFMGAQTALFVVFSIKLLHSAFFAWFFTHEKPLYCFPFCFHRSLCAMFGRRCGREETEAETERAQAQPGEGQTKGVNEERPAEYKADPDNAIPVPKIMTCGGIFSGKLTNHLGAVRNHYHLGHLLFWFGFLIIVMQQADPATRGYVPYKDVREKSNPARATLPPYALSNADPNAPCAHVHTTEWIRDLVTQGKFGVNYKASDADSIASSLATVDTALGLGGGQPVYDFKLDQITFSSPSIYALQDPRFFWPYEGVASASRQREFSHPYESTFSGWPGQLVHGYVGTTQTSRPSLTHTAGNAGANNTYRMLTLNQLQGAAYKYRSAEWSAGTGNGEPYGRVTAVGIADGFGDKNDPRGTWPGGISAAKTAFANPLGWHDGRESKGSDGLDNWFYTPKQEWKQPGLSLQGLQKITSAANLQGFSNRLKASGNVGLPPGVGLDENNNLIQNLAINLVPSAEGPEQYQLADGAAFVSNVPIPGNGANGNCHTFGNILSALTPGSNVIALAASKSVLICPGQNADLVGWACLALSTASITGNSMKGHCTGGSIGLSFAAVPSTVSMGPWSVAFKTLDNSASPPTLPNVAYYTDIYGAAVLDPTINILWLNEIDDSTEFNPVKMASQQHSSISNKVSHAGLYYAIYGLVAGTPTQYDSYYLYYIMHSGQDTFAQFNDKYAAMSSPTCSWPGGRGADGNFLPGCASTPSSAATPIYQCGVTRDSQTKMTETSDTGEALMLSSRLFLLGAIVGLLASLAMALGHVGYGISAVPADFPTNTRICQLNPC